MRRRLPSLAPLRACEVATRHESFIRVEERRTP